jgi:hypothetical protein
MNTIKQQIKDTFDKFFTDRVVVEEAIVSSTKCGWGGGSYSLEVAPDWWIASPTESFGSLYAPAGIIIAIPQLNDEEWDDQWDDDDVFSSGHYYERAIEALGCDFEEALDEAFAEE